MTLSFETGGPLLKDLQDRRYIANDFRKVKGETYEHYIETLGMREKFLTKMGLSRIPFRQNLYENAHSVFWCPTLLPGSSTLARTTEGLAKTQKSLGRKINVVVDFLPGRSKTKWRKRVHAQIRKEVGATVLVPYTRKEWDLDGWLADNIRLQGRRNRFLAVLYAGVRFQVVSMEIAAGLADTDARVIRLDLPILQEAGLVRSTQGIGTWLINPDFVKTSVLRMTDKEIERVVELPPPPEQLYVPPKSKPKKSADEELAGRRRAVLDICKSHNISLLATEEILEAAGLPPL